MKKFILFILILFCNNTYSQIINDESYLDLDFLKFKTELMNCVIQKDTVQLKKFLAARVYESNDTCGYPGCTKEELMNYYFKDLADESWNDLLTLIRFGFTRKADKNTNWIVPHEKVVFQAPSYLKNVDTENELLILAENVNIREKPSLNSEIIRTTSYEKFKCDCSIVTQTDTTYQTINGINWIEIKLNDNNVGYVASKFTSYDVTKELTIAKVNGQWKIISWFNAPGC